MLKDLEMLERNIVKKDFKTLHQKYGTSEVSYAFNELKTLSKADKKKITEEEN